MMKQRITVTIEKMLFGVLLVGALLPLVVVKSLAHPFLTPRELALRVIVAVALPLGVFVWLRSFKKPRFSILGWSIIALFGALVVSTIFSVDPWTSFWGYAERMNGLLSLIIFLVYGLLLYQLFCSLKKRKVFLYAWSAVWLIVMGIALFERFGLVSPFSHLVGGGRVISTFGNPIFLATGVILFTSTALAVLLMRKRTRVRDISAAAVAVIGLIAILFTETRGSYLGVLAGFVTVFIFAAIWKRSRVLRISAVIFPIIILSLIASLWIFRELPQVQSAPFLRRIASIFNTQDASQIQRFQMWNMAIDAFRDRPVFGWGLENVDTAIDRHFDPGFIQFGLENSYADRTHNQYLDVAVTMGIVGVAAYLFFLFAVAHRIWVARREKLLTTGAALASIGGLSAYAVALLTSFDTHATLLGLATAIPLLASVTRSYSSDQKSEIIKVPSMFVGGVMVVCVILSLGLLLQGILPLERGSRIVLAAERAETGSDLSNAATSIMEFSNPYRAHEAHRIGNTIFKIVGESSEKGEMVNDLLDQAEVILRDAVERRQSHFGVRFTYGNILLLQAMNGIRPYKDALAVFSEARILAPQRQIVNYQVGNIYLIQKRPDDAVAEFERAVEADPMIGESHWHLARGLAALGDLPGAASEFRRAIDLEMNSHRPGEEYGAAINVLILDNNLQYVQKIYKDWLENEPENADLYASLATVSAEIGDQEEALAALRKGLVLDPTLASEVPAFLKKYGYPPDILSTQQ